MVGVEVEVEVERKATKMQMQVEDGERLDRSGDPFRWSRNPKRWG